MQLYSIIKQMESLSDFSILLDFEYLCGIRSKHVIFIHEMKNKTIVYYPIFLNQLIISVICLLAISLLFFNLPDNNDKDSNKKLSSFSIDSDTKTIQIIYPTLTTGNYDVSMKFPEIASKKKISMKSTKEQIQKMKLHSPVFIGNFSSNITKNLQKKDIFEKYINTSLHLVTMNNVYAYKNNIFYSNGVFYATDCYSCQRDFCNNLPSNNAYSSAKFDSIISYSYERDKFSYEEWFLKTLPILTLFPSDIINHSQILISSHMKSYFPLLKLVKLPIDSLIEIKDNYMIHGNSVYTIDQKCTINPIALLHLRNIIKRKLKLDMNRPHLYIYSYKHTNYSYSNSIYNEVRLAFPNIAWGTLDIPLKLRDQIRLFNHIKLLITPMDSYLVNVLFMQENSCLCLFQNKHWDDNYVILSHFVGQYTIVAQSKELEFGDDIKDKQIFLLKDMISKALSLLK